jgi:hypothetical protein
MRQAEFEGTIMIKYGFVPLAIAACVSVAAAAAPAEVDETFTASGLLGAEIRVFPDDVEWAGQDNTKFEPSFYGKIDLSYAWGGGRQKILLTPFGRFDTVDDRRTHFDAREASYNYRGDDYDAVIGVHQVFWGRAESRHLVNVINQVDLVENFDGEEYLGQPMINVNFFGDWGKLGLFVMSGFRERTFAGVDARLRGSVPTTNGRSTSPRAMKTPSARSISACTISTARTASRFSYRQGPSFSRSMS